MSLEDVSQFWTQDKNPRDELGEGLAMLVRPFMHKIESVFSSRKASILNSQTNPTESRQEAKIQ